MSTSIVTMEEPQVRTDLPAYYLSLEENQADRGEQRWTALSSGIS